MSSPICFVNCLLSLASSIFFFIYRLAELLQRTSWCSCQWRMLWRVTLHTSRQRCGGIFPSCFAEMCIPVKYSGIDQWNECFLVTSFAFPGLIFFKISSDFAVQIVFQHWNLRSSCFKLKFIIIAIALRNSKFVLSLFLDSVRSGPLSGCVGSSHFSWFRVSMERSYGEKSDKNDAKQERMK